MAEPYAVASDYAEYKGVEDDYDDAERARINAGLLNAQDDIDSVIRVSFYDPTSETVQTALTRATCARFDYAETTGDDGSGALDLFQSASAGSVSLTRATVSSSYRVDPIVAQIGQKAATILANAGLLTTAVAHR